MLGPCQNNQRKTIFSQGHAPATAQYETNLMYSDKPDLIADRNFNPKLCDVYII